MESPFKGKTGLRRLMNAFGYSMAGLKAAYQNEDAFRQEVLLAIILLPLAFFLEHEAIGRADILVPKARGPMTGLAGFAGTSLASG